MPGDDDIVHEGMKAIPDYSGEPAFLFFHLMSTHPFGIKKKEFDGFSGRGIKSDDHHEYADRVGQMDFYVSEILKTLEEKGYIDDSIIFLTSDHGECLGEGGVWGHSSSLRHAVIEIPWLISGVDQELLLNQKIASQLDIAPTALALLEIDAPLSWVGKSLTQPVSETRQLFLEQRDYEGSMHMGILSIRDAGSSIWKYQRIDSLGLLGKRAKHEEAVFDWIEDPLETENRIHSVSPTWLDSVRQIWISRYIKEGY